jgi:ankyrin repeat protein
VAELTEDTIMARTKKGDTPLHRAAKLGKINEIPKHLLQTELFMARNDSFTRETPLHIAARYGHLDQVPLEFLNEETLTASTEYERKQSLTGSKPPRTETPLHTAARYGHADQIPKKFLTPEYLSIEASGYRNTVLHELAYSNSLDLVPNAYATSEMWNLRNSQGQTPREVLKDKVNRAVNVASVRNEPATEKQKEKLRFFGCTWDDGITKGQASDAIDECVRQFPEIDNAYYNRPATENQMTQIRGLLADTPDEIEESYTYGEAKELILDCEREAPSTPARDIFTPRMSKTGRLGTGARVVLTTAQCATPLGQELLKLLLDVVRDGLVAEGGVRRLNAWLEGNVDSDIPAINFLLRVLAGIFQGMLTTEKAFEIQFAIERVLPKSVRVGVTKRRQEAWLHSPLKPKATEAQLEYIRGLGGTPTPGLNIAEASLLIDKLLGNADPPTPRQIMVLRFWNRMDLEQSSKMEVERWLSQFYAEDPSRKAAWETFKMDSGDDGSQQDPSWVPIGASESYLKG